MTRYRGQTNRERALIDEHEVDSHGGDEVQDCPLCQIEDARRASEEGDADEAR